MVIFSILGKLKSFFYGRRALFVSLPIIISFFAIDIYTKRLASLQVDYIIQKTVGVHTYIYINDYLNIVKVINTGISFGMCRNLIYAQIILSLTTSIIVGFICYLLYNAKTNYKITTYSMIIAGGLGNIYDRILFGGVFDFLDFHFKEYHWPAFNIADSIICIGVFLLIFEDLFKKVIYKK
jgi:signal peptidase II